MPAGAGASCRERLIRLKPGLLNGDIEIDFQCSSRGIFNHEDHKDHEVL
jgi:hypothetical protein